MLEHFGSYRRTLYYASVGSEVAAEYSDTACCAVGIVYGTDYVGILVYYALDVLCNGLACAGDEVGIEKSELIDLVHYSVDSACLV